MSDEQTSLKTSVTSPNLENRFSSVNYEDYINSVKGSGHLNEPIEKPVKLTETNAEDEVVAILLSAMMGSIVKEWKIKSTSDKKSHSSSSFYSKKSGGNVATPFEISNPGRKNPTSIVTLGSNISFNKQDVSSLKIKKLETPTSDQAMLTSNSFLNEEALGNTELSLDEGQNNESVNLRPGSSPIHSCADEEDDSTAQLQKLRELLIYDKDDIYGWEFLESGQEVIITFKQGNRFEGKLLNCRMHGKGTFNWADGSVYEGDFYHGKMSGQGTLHWPDGGRYEGELCRGYRHGRGLYVLDPTFYAGYWRCGRRHGVGAMFYNQSDTTRDYYNGEWFKDNKHGTGLRSYPSGAKYSGQWKSGNRQGLGTMVWKNRDVYSGNFQAGRKHGYGEYTWDTFFNQQLVVPEENCYYGTWVKDVRHGNGTLETTSGIIVKGSWKNGKKHGPAEVICSNGNFLYDEDLFEEDCLCLPDGSVEVDSLMNASTQSLYKLPVSAASHEINLRYYVIRLVEFVNESDSFGKPYCLSAMDSPIQIDTKRKFSLNRSLEPTEIKFEFQEEELHIRNVLTQFLSTLKVVYTLYAQVCCEVKPKFPTILMRLMWWQLLRDCNLHMRGFSLAHFDTCIANNKACLVQGVHYPFERILFWQFLHCLIEVSWELYTKKCIGTPSVKGIIASGLHKLITTDIVPNAGRHKGNALFRCKDLMSFDSLYWYYRGIGEPLSAREFLKKVTVPQENDIGPLNVQKCQEHQIRGKNVIGVGGKLTYSPKEEPLLKDREYQDDPNHPKNLSCLNSIGLLGILECILQICPCVSTREIIVNMDYKIVFLEFYEILILCARKNSKHNILDRKKNEMEKESRTSFSENNTNEDPLPQIEESLPVPEKKNQRAKTSPTKKPKKKE